MLKVGVIGTGNMGKNHARIFYEMKDVRLVGISDKNENTRNELKQKYNIQTYERYEDLLSKVDVVTIAVPTKQHKEVTIKALKSGVDCLVEKPISSNIEDSEEMISVSKENNKILAVGHIENFNPAIREVKKIIDDKSLGKILIVSAKRVGPFVERIKDVGIILDLATHEIAAMRYLLNVKQNDIVNVFSSWKGLKNKKGDYAIITMEFGDVILNIEVNWFTPYKSRELSITGSKSVAKVDYEEQKVQIYSSSWIKKLNIIKEEPLWIELDNFINSVKTRTPPLVDGNEGLEIIKIALKAKNIKEKY